MQRIFLLFPFLLTLAGVPAAQDAPRTLMVQGIGRVITAAADIAVFDIGVTTRSPSATSGVRENSVTVAAMLEQLATLRVAADDIQTAGVSVSPVLPRQPRHAARASKGVTERVAAQPGPVFAARGLAESAVPIAPGQLAVEASVTAVFALR